MNPTVYAAEAYLMMQDVGCVSELTLVAQNSKLGFNCQWEYIHFQANFTVLYLT